jgi:hypothetical protein
MSKTSHCAEYKRVFKSYSSSRFIPTQSYMCPEASTRSVLYPEHMHIFWLWCCLQVCRKVQRAFLTHHDKDRTPRIVTTSMKLTYLLRSSRWQTSHILCVQQICIYFLPLTSASKHFVGHLWFCPLRLWFWKYEHEHVCSYSYSWDSKSWETLSHNHIPMSIHAQIPRPAETQRRGKSQFQSGCANALPCFPAIHNAFILSWHQPLRCSRT